MMSRLDIYQRADDRWAWRLVAGNGQVTATDGGQGYENRADCVRMAEAIVRGAYAPPIDLPDSDLEPGWITIACPVCGSEATGRTGDTLVHDAESGGHVHVMVYGI